MRRNTWALAAILLLLAAPLDVGSEQATRVWRIGYLGNVPPSSSPEATRIFGAFQKELQARGYLEGKNLIFEFRFSEGKVERFAALAADLARLKVDVIVAGGGGVGARAAKDATSTIPIVMLGSSDPVAAGLVMSLARPGGNITGVADYQLDLVPKRLELLKAAAPKITHVINIHGQYGVFPQSTRDALAADRARAAHALGLTLTDLEMKAPADFEAAAAALARKRPDALLLSPNPTNFIVRNDLAAFATQHGLPAIGGLKEMAVAGVLLSYGADIADIFRRAAVYVDKILRGAKPADLPVEQPTEFQLVINLRTAKALGLTIPQSILVRANEVIH